MKFEEKKRMTKKELASFLRGLSKKLEEGILDYTRGEVRVPDSLDVEIEYKEKGEKRKFEVEVKWHALEAQRAHEAVNEMPLSEVKQEMKALFKRIRLCIEDGEMPSGKQVARFKELSVMFDYHSKDEEWFEDQLKFREKVKEFETAVESRNLPDAQRLVQEFRVAKKACHKVYRWKEE